MKAAYAADGLEFRPRNEPVMRALDEHGQFTIRALQRLLGVSHCATSQTVAQMVARGLLTGTRGATRARMSRWLDAITPPLRRHWDAATIATAALDREAGGLLAAVTRANEALARSPYAERLGRAVDQW